LRATVSQSSTFDFTLVEFDPRFESEIDALVAGESRIPDKTVLDVSIETNPAYGYDTIEEKKLAESLRDMLVLARRSALDVNSSMQRALSYLDKIAG